MVGGNIVEGDTKDSAKKQIINCRDKQPVVHPIGNRIDKNAVVHDIHNTTVKNFVEPNMGNGMDTNILEQNVEQNIANAMDKSTVEQNIDDGWQTGAPSSKSPAMTGKRTSSSRAMASASEVRVAGSRNGKKQ